VTCAAYHSNEHMAQQRGVHVASRGNAALPTDMVKVLKSQDANYIRTVRNNGRKACATYLLLLDPV